MCDSTCMKCANSSTNCSECQIGYYLDNTTCLPCSSNCSDCTSIEECSSCDSGYQVVGGHCVSCTNAQYYSSGQCYNCS